MSSSESCPFAVGYPESDARRHLSAGGSIERVAADIITSGWENTSPDSFAPLYGGIADVPGFINRLSDQVVHIGQESLPPADRDVQALESLRRKLRVPKHAARLALLVEGVAYMFGQDSLPSKPHEGYAISSPPAAADLFNEVYTGLNDWVQQKQEVARLGNLVPHVTASVVAARAFMEEAALARYNAARHDDAQLAEFATFFVGLPLVVQRFVRHEYGRTITAALEDVKMARSANVLPFAGVSFEENVSEAVLSVCGVMSAYARADATMSDAGFAACVVGAIPQLARSTYGTLATTPYPYIGGRIEVVIAEALRRGSGARADCGQLDILPGSLEDVPSSIPEEGFIADMHARAVAAGDDPAKLAKRLAVGACPAQYSIRVSGKVLEQYQRLSEMMSRQYGARPDIFTDSDKVHAGRAFFAHIIDRALRSGAASRQGQWEWLRDLDGVA